jgi:hypothetical protein
MDETGSLTHDSPDIKNIKGNSTDSNLLGKNLNKKQKNGVISTEMNSNS